MTQNDRVAAFFRLGELQKQALRKLRIETVRDLLYHFPSRYDNAATIKTIRELQKGDVVVIFSRLSHLEASKAFYKKIPLASARASDDTGSIKIVWFNQPYLAKMIREGALVRLEGKVSERKGILYISNPKVKEISHVDTAGGESLFGNTRDNQFLHPIYPESRGITANWFYHAIRKVLKNEVFDAAEDLIEAAILKKYHLPSWKTAMVWIHAPKKKTHALAARKRFAFEEVFCLQLEKQRARGAWEKKQSFIIGAIPRKVERFVTRFPFTLTGAQRRAIEVILNDFKRGRAMARLLEGDVGSGKTVVAATTAYAVVATKPSGQNFVNLQVAYMAPTEVLATQQFENFIQYFSGRDREENSPVNIGLLTGSGCRKFPSKVNPHAATNISRAQLLRWVENGEIPILVGTHALIQKEVRFKHLAYVIIDEQHRFGVRQRAELLHKAGRTPHLLSMTATPIPRTLALTIYGDLDLTLLDEMPPGRKPVITEVVLPDQRQQTYEKVRRELVAGRQVYIICPRIEEPDPTKALALYAKSVRAEAKRLKKEVFPEFEIGTLHSKMKPAEKEKTIKAFQDDRIQILVATSVVEVGVNIRNAVVIIIEGAERFGLAQLHQLRGRVLRSTRQAYCFVFADTTSGSVIKRLRALQTAKNGFELAELDLTFRGPGELTGVRQWGISDIAMEALKNLKMVEAARTEVETLLTKDETLSSYPLLKARLAHRGEREIHFE